MKKYLSLILAFLYPGVSFAQTTVPLKPLIYRILDTGIFVLVVVVIYFTSVYLGRKNMKIIGSGSLYNMLGWLIAGLGFGMLFQVYIFIFDYKHVGGFSAADISLGWHLFFVITILLMLVGMFKMLKR